MARAGAPRARWSAAIWSVWASRHEYVDLERDSESVRRLQWLTGGTASHPTVYIGGEWLVEPTMRELEWALMRSGLR
jgi:mycoredoxin